MLQQNDLYTCLLLLLGARHTSRHPGISQDICVVNKHHTLLTKPLGSVLPEPVDPLEAASVSPKQGIPRFGKNHSLISGGSCHRHLLTARSWRRTGTPKNIQEHAFSLIY